MPSRCCFAKVNFTLDILGLRDDGYHNLASVFQTVSLHDDLEAVGMPGREALLDCSDASLPSGASNLVVRAVKALLRETGREAGIRFALEKVIPSQAGLGGGSSDAAGALLLANELLGLEVSPERLSALAGQLGSDVPFFLAGGTAAVRGRGELVQLLDDGPPLWFVVVKPGTGVPTGEAYSSLDAIEGRTSNRATGRMIEALRNRDPGRVVAAMSNDFERTVPNGYPEVGALLDDLLMAGASNSRLCGSGSACFGACLDRAQAETVARRARLKYDQVHLCRSVSREDAKRGGEVAL
jgi:4-diphosphocytidyl-2-C-methyl-D-erythritol kinase